MSRLVKIPANKLFVSEPHPSMFGNGKNPSNPQREGWTSGNWLKSRFHFNFAEYNNHRNPPFGVLYVCNDDLVQPRRGFGPHPHSNMEIVTYVVDGELTHADSKGNQETLGRGSVQFMSAGTGITHSEFNKGASPCRFVQAWILPATIGLKPNYGSYSAPKGDTPGWKHLVSDSRKATDAPVTVQQDIDVYTNTLSPNATTEVEVPDSRQAYLMCLEGGVHTSYKNTALTASDAAEIYGNMRVFLTAGPKGAHLLMYQMAHAHGSGRRDL